MNKSMRFYISFNSHWTDWWCIRKPGRGLWRKHWHQKWYHSFNLVYVAWSSDGRPQTNQTIVGSNPARIFWSHLWTEVFEVAASAPMSSMENETAVKLLFIHSFIRSDRSGRAIKYEVNRLGVQKPLSIENLNRIQESLLSSHSYCYNK